MFTRLLVLGPGIVLPLCFWTTIGLGANPRTANPSAADPDEILAIHGDETSVKVHAECTSRCAALVKLLPPVRSRLTKGNVAKSDPAALADAYVTVAQMTRLASQLMLLGEPSGAELQLRALYLQTAVNDMIAQIKTTPAGAQYLAATQQKLPSLDRPRAAALQKLNNLLKAKQYAEAEQVFYDYLDQVLAISSFLSTAEVDTKYVAPFNLLKPEIVTAMANHRYALGKQLVTQRRDSQRPDVSRLVARIGTVSKALAAAPQVDLDGMSLTGPEAFGHLMSEWQKMHAAALRCQGLNTILHTPRTVIEEALTLQPNPDELKDDPALADYRTRAAAQISGALAGLVEAEATRVAPADVPALYLAWLEAVAPHVGRVQGDALARAIDPALRKLAGRSPAFLAQVSAYDEVTSDLLRWKRRTADAATLPFVAQQPALEVAFQKAFTSDNSQAYIGLFAPDQTSVSQPAFLAAAPAVLPAGSQRLLGQQVLLNAGQGLGGGKTNVTRLRQRTFATLKPNQAALASAAAELAAELLVTPEQPPLTLTATAAIRSLQQGDFVTCGGEVTALYLEGWLTRLAGLPDAAWPVYALGDVPSPLEGQGAAQPTLNMAAARCEIEPKWLRHEYVIVPLAAAP